MHLLIALFYLGFDLFRHASPLTITIAVIFLLLALYHPHYSHRRY